MMSEVSYDRQSGEVCLKLSPANESILAAAVLKYTQTAGGSQQASYEIANFEKTKQGNDQDPLQQDKITLVVFNR